MRDRTVFGGSNDWRHSATTARENDRMPGTANAGLFGHHNRVVMHGEHGWYGRDA
ncbi:MAG: hypothetical protein OXI81_06110 [Paracoccaceae bacterium]|nr:hypothetical protein [Paracoccaceae bacterium]